MADKFYGCFKICFNAGKTDAKNEKLWQIFYGNILENGGTMYALSSRGYNVSKSDKVYKDKNEAQYFAADCRFDDKEARRDERAAYHCYKHRFFVHECDSNGKFIISKAEIKNALIWAFDNGWVKKDFVNIKPEYRDAALKIKAQLEGK